ncbi:cytidine deaminase [candidate division KSB1 bacterium]|nr:cytidine deaminase [candidate division KSB1 bacterium]
MDKLITAAQQAKVQALATYSNFRVGAALETATGKIYTGCNIESSSYGLTCCAERVAIFKALSEGERDFIRISVAADTEEFCTPCGACRQVLWDYAKNLEILCINKHGALHTIQLRDLLPEAFDDHLLKQG